MMPARHFDCPSRTPSSSHRRSPARERLLQYAGRILRRYDGKVTAEVRDYHDELTGDLASSLAKRAPGYSSLGFPTPASFPALPAPERHARRNRKDRLHASLHRLSFLSNYARMVSEEEKR
jgi:superfamily II DNA or RNA helicase